LFAFAANFKVLVFALTSSVYQQTKIGAKKAVAKQLHFVYFIGNELFSKLLFNRGHICDPGKG